RTVAETTETVTCAHGLRVVPDVAWSEVGDLDLFLLPGGNSRPLRDDPVFVQRMRDLAGARLRRASVCTGALVFGAAGLLDGRPATTHWSALESLGKYGAILDEEARFVD